MKAYKAFDKDLKCRGVQYEVGHTFYEDSNEIVICKSGIHCCERMIDVFNYYPKSNETRVCEVEVFGDIDKEGNKIACREISIIRELTSDEIKSMTDNFKFNSGHSNSGSYNSGDHNSGDYNSGDHNSGNYNSGYYNSGNYNTGDYNSGHYNSGNRNSGHYNSGHYNSGNRNSGHYNSGNRNSGDHNSGDYNSGDHNSGDFNSGHYNSGDSNSGDFNSGDYNSGHFNTNEPTMRMFNKDTGLTRDEISIPHHRIRTYLKSLNTWIPVTKMTEQEKQDNPSHKTTGGYLKYKELIRNDKKVTKEDRKLFETLPNFDAEIFLECTGIDLTKKNKIITIDGKDIEISEESFNQLKEQLTGE